MTDTPKNVVGIRPDLKLEEDTLEPDVDVINLLEELLQQARQGILVEVAVVGMYYDQVTMTSAHAWQGLAYNSTLMCGEMFNMINDYTAWSREEIEEYE